MEVKEYVQKQLDSQLLRRKRIDVLEFELEALMSQVDEKAREVIESMVFYHGSGEHVQTSAISDTTADIAIVPFPVSWTVKMKKKQKETQDILSYHSQAAGCSDKARAKASGGRQPIEECGRTGL